MNCSGKYPQQNEQNTDTWLSVSVVSEQVSDRRIRESCYTQVYTHTKYLSCLQWFWVWTCKCGQIMQTNTPRWEEQKKNPAVYHPNASSAGELGESTPSSLLIEKGEFVVCDAEIYSNPEVKVTFQSFGVLDALYMHTNYNKPSSWISAPLWERLALNAFVPVFKRCCSWELNIFFNHYKILTVHSNSNLNIPLRDYIKKGIDYLSNSIKTFQNVFVA